jgi:gentisate 1,2-dioxygenase
LRLSNPGLPYGTTPSLWASIQVILPGETATAHRHAASALRFIMKGSGAFTTVNGEEYAMNESDFVITPAWTWHDHTHRGDEQMIWLDILDISLVRSMHATFFEGSSVPMQSISDEPQKSWQQFGSGIMRPVKTQVHNPVNPLLVYPAAVAERALEAASEVEPDPYMGTMLEYQNPTTGESALPTISSCLQRLGPGFQTLEQRHTGSLIIYVMSGSGSTQAGESKFDWQAGDFMAIPPWTWYSHQNGNAESAKFFLVSDIPTLKALKMYREEFASRNDEKVQAS